MITSNFKKLVMDILQHMGNYGAYPIKSVSNVTRYTVGTVPSTASVNVQKSTSSSGIYIGTGSTAPTEDDYKLESMLTSGFTGSVNATHNMDGGVHSLVFDVTITNTGDSAITISEIGYSVQVNAAGDVGGTSVSNTIVLVDRTVLSSPVTIAAGDYETIRYTLKTVAAS